MPFVIDTSVAAAWLLPGEDNREAERALSLLEPEDALVPGLSGTKCATSSLPQTRSHRQR
jgi:hypothetical protein